VELGGTRSLVDGRDAKFNSLLIAFHFGIEDHVINEERLGDSSVIPREVLKTEYDRVDQVDRMRSRDETASARRDAFATGEREPRLFH